MSLFLYLTLPWLSHESPQTPQGILSHLALHRNSLPCGIISLWILLIISYYRSGNPSAFKHKKHDEALSALLVLLSPTTSFWPVDIIKAASLHKNKIMKISLHQLYAHIISGAIEFRNPSDDLATLLRDGGTYPVGEWSIQLVMDSPCWSSITLWIIRSFSTVFKVSICA
jgi:hypothetical protein